MSKKIIISIIFLSAILSVGTFFVFKNKNKSQVKEKQQEIVNIVKLEEETEQPEATSNIIASTTDEIDTSGWKTYRNEEYGFELKYPEDLIVEEKFFNKHGWRIYAYLKEDLNEVDGLISFGVSDSATNFKDWKNSIPLIENEQYTYNQEIINNMVAYKMHQKFNSVDGNVNAMIYSFEKNNMLYKIIFSVTNENVSKSNLNEAVFGKIIKTFHFLN